MELRQLRYFMMVAEELHFARAAERLHMAQQPLSFQIKQLEEELGSLLFKRTTRHVELTEFGKIFLKEVRLAFRHLDEGIEAAQRAQRGEIGRLVVGYISTTLYSILPATVRLFRERFPDVEVVLQEMVSPSLEQQIGEGLIDVGWLLAPSEGDIPALEVETVACDVMMAALPFDHPLAEHETLSLLALSNEPFIMFSRKSKPQAYDQMIALCHAAGFSPHIAQEVANEPALMGLVAAGIGITLTTGNLQKVRNEEIAYRIIDPPRYVKIIVAWKPGTLSPQVQALLSIAREVGVGAAFTTPGVGAAFTTPGVGAAFTTPGVGAS
jgi:DNA-binding transcriptional LysR family regulator